MIILLSLCYTKAVYFSIVKFPDKTDTPPPNSLTPMPCDETHSNSSIFDVFCVDKVF